MTDTGNSNTRFQDADYLLNQQYQSSKNLEARINLHARFSTNTEGIHRWLVDEALQRLGSAANILELGCGQGRLWTANADRIPGEWNLTLTDFSVGMVSATEANLAGHFEGRKNFDVVDAQSIPYPDASFDAVFAHFMLYHVPDRNKAYREILRVLKPGGWFMTAALGKNHLREIYQMAMYLEETPPDKWTLSFRVDNGAAELMPFFNDVNFIDFQDGLIVTEEEPLVDYLRSMIRTKRVDPKKLEGLRQEIRERLKRDRVIEIAKESGLFVCRSGDFEE